MVTGMSDITVGTHFDVTNNIKARSSYNSHYVLKKTQSIPSPREEERFSLAISRMRVSLAISRMRVSLAISRKGSASLYRG